MKSSICYTCNISSVFAKGLCRKCYAKQYYRNTLAGKPPKPTHCEQCGDAPIRSKGMCQKCYTAASYAKRSRALLDKAKLNSALLTDEYVRGQLRGLGVVNPSDAEIHAKRDSLAQYRLQRAADKEAKHQRKLAREQRIKKEKLPQKHVPCMCCGKPRNAGKACDVCLPLDVRRAAARRSSKTQNKRAKQNGVMGRLSAGLFERLFTAQHGTCPACLVALSDKSPRSPMDHIVPYANGGLNVDTNIQLLCHSCNSLKGVRDNDEFMIEMWSKL